MGLDCKLDRVKELMKENPLNLVYSKLTESEVKERDSLLVLSSREQRRLTEVEFKRLQELNQKLFNSFKNKLQ